MIFAFRCSARFPRGGGVGVCHQLLQAAVASGSAAGCGERRSGRGETARRQRRQSNDRSDNKQYDCRRNISPLTKICFVSVESERMHISSPILSIRECIFVFQSELEVSKISKILSIAFLCELNTSSACMGEQSLIVFHCADSN